MLSLGDGLTGLSAVSQPIHLDDLGSVVRARVEVELRMPLGPNS